MTLPLPLILAGLLLAPVAFAAEEPTTPSNATADASLPDSGENAAKTAPVPNRFLLVLDTSASMKNRAEAIQGFLRNFVGSSLLGQGRRDDTLGFWTFNEELWAGRFPLVLWHPSSVPTYAYRAEQFAAAQTYENEARMERLMPHITRLVERSEALTIVLITSGESPIEGTPFDAEINLALSASARQLRGDRLAFVVCLVAREGKLVDFAVNSTLGPYRMPNPPLPRRPIPDPPPETPDPSTVPQRAKPGTPALIISSNPPPSSVPVADAPTASERIEADELEPKPRPSVETADSNPPATSPVPSQPAVARPAESTRVQAPVATTPAPRPQPTETPTPAPRESAISQPPIPTPQEQAPPRTRATPPEPVRAVTESTRTAPTASPVPAPVSATESRPNPGRTAPPPDAAPVTPSPESTATTPRAAETDSAESSLPPMAVTGQEPRVWDPFMLAAVGFILAGVAMAIYLWRQGSRPTRPSLISRAIKDRAHQHED
jgi:hypothetical protein